MDQAVWICNMRLPAANLKIPGTVGEAAPKCWLATSYSNECKFSSRNFTPTSPCHKMVRIWSDPYMEAHWLPTSCIHYCLQCWRSPKGGLSGHRRVMGKNIFVVLVRHGARILQDSIIVILSFSIYIFFWYYFHFPFEIQFKLIFILILFVFIVFHCKEIFLFGYIFHCGLSVSDFLSRDGLKVEYIWSSVTPA